MCIVRPIQEKDIDEIYELSALASAGLTSLPHDRELLELKIKDSVLSFERRPNKPGGEVYLFVFEDLNEGRIAGTTAIYSKVGGYQPFYTYKINSVTKKSNILNVRKDIKYLKLIEDHNGPTEIGTLFLAPDYRKSGNGRLLSLSRFMFMAEFPHCFEDIVIAEMRGVIDENDQSPFWEALGKHFFDTEFKNADMMTLRDKSFIADLMPKHPIYVPLLPRNAQDVIGQVHDSTKPALHLLEKEGFEHQGEIDIFEAGPLVRCAKKDILTFKKSRTCRVSKIVSSITAEKLFMISNTQSFQDFKTTLGKLRVTPDGVEISSDVSATLDLQIQSPIRYAPFKAKGE